MVGGGDHQLKVTLRCTFLHASRSLCSLKTGKVLLATCIKSKWCRGRNRGDAGYLC